MKRPYVFGTALVIGLQLIGCSRPTYHSAQWAASSDGLTLLYSLDARIYTRSRLKTDRPRALVQGACPCFIDSSGRFAMEINRRIAISDPSGSRIVPITSPNSDQTDDRPAVDEETGRIYFARFTERGITRRSGFELCSCKFDGSDFVQLTNENFFALRLSTQSIYNHRITFVVAAPESQASPANSDWSGIATVNLEPPFHLNYSSTAVAKPWEISIAPHSGTTVVVGGPPNDQKIEVLSASGNQMQMISTGSTKPEWPMFVGSSSEIQFLAHSNTEISVMSLDQRGRLKAIFKLTP